MMAANNMDQFSDSLMGDLIHSIPIREQLIDLTTAVSDVTDDNHGNNHRHNNHYDYEDHLSESMASSIHNDLSNYVETWSLNDEDNDQSKSQDCNNNLFIAQHHTSPATVNLSTVKPCTDERSTNNKSSSLINDSLLSSSMNLINSENMSLIENNKSNNSFNFNQTEEHFEFTPSLDDTNDLKKENIDDADEDFSFSNGDSSYNSLKSTFNQRNTWLRSSVKRSGSTLKRNSSLGPYSSSPYRNSPTNGTNSLSRRSSISYESDEMNNGPNSLEEDVHNLTEKIKKLQDQIQILSEGQQNNEIKYSSVKKENSNLLSKIHVLEEQIRDIEFQSDTKVKEDERRFKDTMARVEREKSQEIEHCVNRICTIQKELVEAKEEIKRHQHTIERLQITKEELECNVQDKEYEIQALSNEITGHRETIRKQDEECNAKSKLLEALNHELIVSRKSNDVLTNDHQNQHHTERVNSINSELEEQLRMLKDENRSLKEANEELTAQLLNNHLIEGKSLLREGEAISSLANEISDLNIEQLKTTLKEQQDVNAKLRAYIDGILLNIVENYPQLLEVKPN